MAARCPHVRAKNASRTIGRLWTMLVHAQATLLDQSKLASSLGVASPTVGRYVDLLVDLPRHPHAGCAPSSATLSGRLIFQLEDAPRSPIDK
jgi:hypothetical protein